MKYSILSFLMLWIKISGVQAQHGVEDLLYYVQQLKQQMDSVKFYENQFNLQKISELEFRKKMAEFSIPIIDNGSYIYSENYPLLDGADSSEMDPENLGEMELSDSTNWAIEPEETYESLDSFPTDLQNEEGIPKRPATKLIRQIIAGSDLKRTSWNLSLGFGFSSLTNELTQNGASTSFSPNLVNNYSIPLEYGLVFRTRIGNEKSIFGIYYGLIYNRFILRQTKDIHLLNKLGENDYLFEETNLPLKKSVLHANYLKIPLGIDLRIKKIWITLGAYGGFLMSSKQILQFESDLKQSKQIFVNHLGINRYQYGVEGLIGYKKLGITYSMQLNEFLKGTNPVNHKIYQLGVRWRI